MLALFSTWWTWMAAAFVLAILEMLAPGWILLGFAIGAGGTGLILLIGGPMAAWLAGSLPMLFAFFAVLSLIAWFVLRRAFGNSAGSVKTFEHDINEG
ncbi:MAG: hypothetical protein AAFY03_03050 [Pseudomonadota bacterium]